MKNDYPENYFNKRVYLKQRRHNRLKILLAAFFLTLSGCMVVLACSPGLRSRCFSAAEHLFPVDRPAQAAQAVGVTTVNLHMRSGAGTSYEIICTIPKGSSVHLLSGTGAGAEWVQVKAPDGQTGWCCSQYLNIGSQSAVPSVGKTESETGSPTSKNSSSSSAESAQPAEAEVHVSLSEATRPLSISVSLADQTVKVLDAKGRVVQSFTCSSGTKGSETPTGTYTTKNRGQAFYSDRVGEGAYYWTQFYGNYLFHSVPFDKDRKMEPEEAAKLGTPASHGCIRLAVKDAKWIYDNIPKGTSVVIR